MLNIAAVLAVFVASLLSQGSQPNDNLAPPAVIASKSAHLPPVWVRADRAVTEGGQLSADLGEFRDQIEQYTERVRDSRQRASTASTSSAASDCGGVFMYAPLSEHHISRDTADELAANAREIVLGRAIGAVQGFYYGTPGTLFTVDVDTTVTPSISGHAYVFFPYARIVSADRAFCSNPIGTDARPAIGDRILLFSMIGPDDMDGQTYHADAAREMAFETASGALYLPKALKADPSLSSLRTLREIARDVMSRRGAPPKPAAAWRLKRQ